MENHSILNDVDQTQNAPRIVVLEVTIRIFSDDGFAHHTSQWLYLSFRELCNYARLEKMSINFAVELSLSEISYVVYVYAHMCTPQ